MNFSLDSGEGEGPIRVREPTVRSVPFVFASPHSGRVYPGSFLEQAVAPLTVLRRSEDAYVDRLFAEAPAFGAPLIEALFPRVFVDPNRHPWELDPAMFDEPLPDVAGPTSSRAAAGLGVVPRLAADGRLIHRRRLTLSEAVDRVEQYYQPYHERLRGEIAATKERFGEAFIIDCHSMPAASARGADIVLGDRYGASCSRAFVANAEAHFRALGFAVVRNRPYAGGYTTEHYGRPARGIHALQVEINRGLYLDERSVRPARGMTALSRALTEWMKRMTSEDISGQIAAE